MLRIFSTEAAAQWQAAIAAAMKPDYPCRTSAPTRYRDGAGRMRSEPLANAVDTGRGY
jgi:hypothetical protein